MKKTKHSESEMVKAVQELEAELYRTATADEHIA